MRFIRSPRPCLSPIFQYGAKDMWNSCKTYGHVIDAYIPNKRSNAGKRFGFVRFIKVADVERLVNNLCTVWVGHYKLHANVARFQREPLNKHSNHYNDNGLKRVNAGVRNNVVGVEGAANSYAHAVKGTQLLEENSDNNPSLVLDDSCLNQKDYSFCLMGKVKDFASLSNLKVVLANEGFSNMEFKYMGGSWVMIEFESQGAKKSFQSNLGTGTWFSQIIQASYDFTIDERVTWVEIEGVPLKMWSRNTFSRIASRWGDLLDGDDQEDGCFHRKRICISTKMKANLFESFKVVYRGKIFWVRAKEVPGWVPDFVDDNEQENDSDDGSYEGELNVGGLKNLLDLEGDSDGEEVPESKFEEEPNKPMLEEVSGGQYNGQSEDPFGLYDILNKKSDANNKDSVPEDSIKYPPGFTPRDDKDTSEEVSYVNWEKTRESDVQEVASSVEKQADPKNKVTNDVEESICSGHFKTSEVPCTGGSILQLIDDLVKVGQTMGYDMKGCMKNMEEIIESQGANKVHR